MLGGGELDSFLTLVSCFTAGPGREIPRSLFPSGFRAVCMGLGRGMLGDGSDLAAGLLAGAVDFARLFGVGALPPPPTTGTISPFFPMLNVILTFTPPALTSSAFLLFPLGASPHPPPFFNSDLASLSAFVHCFFKSASNFLIPGGTRRSPLFTASSNRVFATALFFEGGRP